MPDTLPVQPLTALHPGDFETPRISRHLVRATRALAEFKGVLNSIPHQQILLNTLGLQEAKDSSAIENIVTTHDEIYRTDLFPDLLNPAAKEVSNYRQALLTGYDSVLAKGFISTNHILAIQAELEKNNADFRKLPGTSLKDGNGNIVYAPPQSPGEIVSLMSDLEHFINSDDTVGLDPLVKMAIIHHQFESIHPFYDGNGRTGRIINVLYLVKEGLLDLPVLYLSHHIVQTKTRYYELLQQVRQTGQWEDWAVYMLESVENTARGSLAMIEKMSRLLMKTKELIRTDYKFYSQDLIHSLFRHPYTKIEFFQRDLSVSRLTATKYLEALTVGGLLKKQKAGRSNYYINLALMELLTGE